jgi:hypothetical protein
MFLLGAMLRAYNASSRLKSVAVMPRTHTNRLNALVAEGGKQKLQPSPSIHSFTYEPNVFLSNTATISVPLESIVEQMQVRGLVA